MTARRADSTRKLTFPLARVWIAARLALPFGDWCEVWPFGHGKDGYGYFWNGNKVERVSRFVCRTVHGPAPSPKLDAAHSCNTRPCFNPRHIRWATRSENNLDKRQHGTSYVMTAKRALAHEKRWGV